MSGAHRTSKPSVFVLVIAAQVGLVSLTAACTGVSTTATAGATQAGPTASVPAATQSTVITPTPISAATGGAKNGAGYATSLIPSGVWIQASQIPLYASYHWNSPNSVDKQAANPHSFSLSADCQSQLNSGDQGTVNEFPAATALIQPGTGGSGGDNDWLAEEQIVAAPDFSSGSIQSLSAVFTDLVAQATSCAATSRGAHIAVGTSTGSAYSATLTIPTPTGATLTVHEYLAMPYGYLVEFTEWVAPYTGRQPNLAWSGSADGSVLAALQSGPCAVSKEC